MSQHVYRLEARRYGITAVTLPDGDSVEVGDTIVAFSLDDSFTQHEVTVVNKAHSGCVIGPAVPWSGDEPPTPPA